MSDTALVLLCLAFVALGLFNAWRAWHWTEIPEGIEGRERAIPVLIPCVIFFGAFPLAMGLSAVLGGPEDGSPAAVAVGVVGGAIALAGAALGVTTYWFGRPQWMIAPIGRHLPRWAPRKPEDRRLHAKP
jgi:hypothetical protein